VVGGQIGREQLATRPRCTSGVTEQVIHTKVQPKKIPPSFAAGRDHSAALIGEPYARTMLT
jgi:hypothetical protein